MSKFKVRYQRGAWIRTVTIRAADSGGAEAIAQQRYPGAEILSVTEA